MDNSTCCSVNSFYDVMCTSVVCFIQLVDDLLDFISSENIMGKPASADLKLGLATAPVLFAAHQVNFVCCLQYFVFKVLQLCWNPVLNS